MAMTSERQRAGVRLVLAVIVLLAGVTSVLLVIAFASDVLA
jgi:hypothetical protein